MNAAKLAILLTIVGILLVSTQHSYAQNRLVDGCDERVQSRIAVTTALPYADACEVYRICEPEANGFDSVCLLSVANVLVSACAEDDLDCRTNALLYTASIPLLKWVPATGARSDYALGNDPLVRLLIAIFDPDLEDERPPQEERFEITVARIISTLNAAEYGLYRTALRNYSRFLDSNSGDWVLILFSQAVIHQRLGELALASYAEAIRFSDNLLPHYARALLYGNLSRTTEASFEVEWLRLESLYHPNLAMFIDSLRARYPLNDSLRVTWRRYPMNYIAHSNSQQYRDDTTQPSYLVELYFDEASGTIFTPSLSDPHSPYCNEPCFDPALLAQDINTLDYQGSSATAGDIVLTPEGEAFSGSAATTVGTDSTWEVTFYLAPPHIPDPRISLPGERCGVLSRLEVGMQVETAQSPGFSLLDAPDGVYIDDPNNGYIWEATTVGGGVCVNDKMWWEVITDDGLTGWVAENFWTWYAINPTNIQ